MISGGEIIVILIVVLIVFGPDKIPELGRALGKVMRELNKAMHDVRTQIEAESGEPEKDAGKEAGETPMEKKAPEDKSDSKDK